MASGYDGTEYLVLPYMFVPHGAEPCPKWLAAHPEWFRIPATMRRRVPRRAGAPITWPEPPDAFAEPEHRDAALPNTPVVAETTLPRGAPTVLASFSGAASVLGAQNGNVVPAASADDPQGIKMARSAAKRGGLTSEDEFEIFQDAISGRGITDFLELVRIAKRIKETGGY